jgi:hypothetical protein
MSLDRHRVALEDVTPRSLVSEILVFPMRRSLRPANDDCHLNDQPYKALARPPSWYLPSTRIFVVAGGLLLVAALLAMFLG